MVESIELLLLVVYLVSILDLGVSSCSNSIVVSEGKLSSTDSIKFWLNYFFMDRRFSINLILYLLNPSILLYQLWIQDLS